MWAVNNVAPSFLARIVSLVLGKASTVHSRHGAAESCRSVTPRSALVSEGWRREIVTIVESLVADAVHEQGDSLRSRGRFWLLQNVRRSSLPIDPMPTSGSTQHHLVHLVPIDDKGPAEPTSAFWETELGTEIRPQASLPANHVDALVALGEFSDAGG